jgi:hypothetical protein
VKYNHMVTGRQQLACTYNELGVCADNDPVVDTWLSCEGEGGAATAAGTAVIIDGQLHKQRQGVISELGIQVLSPYLSNRGRRADATPAMLQLSMQQSQILQTDVCHIQECPMHIVEVPTARRARPANVGQIESSLPCTLTGTVAGPGTALHLAGRPAHTDSTLSHPRVTAGVGRAPITSARS